jgi:hypothetical protein
MINMEAGHKSLYLYLALACFLGIILIFIFDGYMGVYDTVIMDKGTSVRTVEADQWSDEANTSYYTRLDIRTSNHVAFTYEIQNRTFFTYSADVEVIVEHEQRQIAVLLFQPIEVSAFSEEQLEWELNTVEFVPAGLSSDQRCDLLLLINRGEVERQIPVYVVGDK